MRMDRRAVLAGLGAAPLMAAAGPGRAPVIDGLSFVPDDLDDIARAGLDAFVADVSEGEFVDGADGRKRYIRTFEACDRSIDAKTAKLATAPTLARLATRGSQITAGGPAEVFFQFQSCESIGTDLSRIGHFHRKGLRLLQIVHNSDNLFGGACLEAKPIGLTKLGFEGVEEMERLRILPDVSHASEATALDVGRATRRPFVLSHGACRALLDNPRCASDAMIRAVADKGGVVGVFMMSFWLTRDDPPTPEHWVAHVRHLKKVGGIDIAAVANDYPMGGSTEPASEYESFFRNTHARGVPGFATPPTHNVIAELNTIGRMEALRRALERGGFRASEIDKVMGGNWRRVLTEGLG